MRTPGQAVSDLSFMQLMFAGTMAGISQTVITYPLETVRVRLTLPPDFLGGFRYRGIAHCFTHTVQREGPTALYKGLTASLLASPYVGLQLTLYQWLQNQANLFLRKQEGSPSLPWTWKVGIGGLSGVIAQSVMYPGDTVRRCMQAAGAGASAQPSYTSTWHCITSIAKTEGLIGFYRGAWVNAIKVVPGAMIQFASYDYFKRVLC
jgi:solute carrier family 25 (mitochondrial phosphate transporter), member 23/24/25/41